ncbi:MAG TPA: hypothetical protein VLD67_03570 [Vicinamibacterales bacterium]|nr:hypothetical protein [Vicinamibacterales bacterium]
MNELDLRYRRWRAADEEGRDEEGDHAFKAVFHAVRSEQPVSPTFAARTMEAVAAAAARDANRARRTRAALVWGSVFGGAAAAYFGASLAISALAAGLLRLLDLMVAVVVGAATGFEAGTDFWSVLTGLGRALAAFAADPTVTIVVLAVQGIAIAALFGLQRLLGSDGESLE